MQCPCCGAKLELVAAPVEVEGEPAIEKEPRTFPPCRPDPPEEHSKKEARWAVRVIKESREQLFYAGALIKGVFGCRGIMVITTVGLYKVHEWAKVTNCAGRQVLLDVWR